MAMRGRTAAVAVIVSIAMLVLASCDQPMLFPDVVDTSFGAEGVLEMTFASYWTGVVTLEDHSILVFDYTTGRLSRKTATGAPYPGWTAPVLPGSPTYLGLGLDGTVVLALTAGGTATLTRLDSSGAEITAARRLLPTTTLRYFGRSPWGALATVAQTCPANTTCDSFVVDHFTVTGDLRYETTVSFEGTSDSPCAYNANARWVLAHDDGSTTVAVPRCSAAGTSSSTSLVARRILPDGTIDPSYGAGKGYAVLVGSANQVVLNDSGEVLELASGTTLQRLTRDGLPDAAFGVNTTAKYLGSGHYFDTIVADGPGYVGATIAGFGCANPNPATMVYIGPDGGLRKTYVTPVSVGGSNLKRFPNGDILVSGGSLVPPSGGTGACSAPITWHLLMLTTPPPT